MVEVSEHRKRPDIIAAFEALETDPRLQVDMSLMQELENMTAYSKSKRDISAARYKTREDLHTLAQPYEEIQHYRGRALRIKTGLLPLHRILKRMWSACVTSLYRSEELIKLSPAARKETALAAILEPLRERMDDCEMVIETATEVEKLLSNAYYTIKELRGINEAFIYEQKRERNV